MTRRLLAATAGALALALALPLAASASRTMTIRLVSVTATFDPSDFDPPGPSKGDRYTGTNLLRNRVAQIGKPKGALVGRDRVAVAFLTAKRTRTVGVATLPGGTIRFSRTGPLVPAPRLTIVGGTGRYAGARGTIAVSTRRDTTYNTYSLTLGS